MSKIVSILDEVKARLSADPKFAQRVTHVLSEEDFFDKLKAGVQYPIVGILYEGARSTSEGGRPSHRMGLAAEVGVTFILALEGKSAFGADIRTTAINLLDDIRTIFRDTASETGGHTFRFVLEAPALEKNGIVLWLQRWSTPAILTD